MRWVQFHAVRVWIICRLSPIGFATRTLQAINAAHQFDTPRAKLDGLVRENVIAQLANLRTHPSVALALEQGRMNLHGWVYDIEMGRIDALDGETRGFVPLSDSPTVAVAARKEKQI